MVDNDLTGRWRLVVREQFSAAHALRNYGGKCESAHGHNFAVEAIVEGEKLDPATGILLDFGVLKAGLRQILAALDHKDLNRLAQFEKENPSSELIARYIGIKMLEFLASAPDPQARRVCLKAVSVSEKSAQTAIWLAPS